MDLGTLLFGFNGRINRAKYWLATLIYFVVSVIVVGVEFGLGEESIAGPALRTIVDIGIAISGIAVGIKRLHDRDKSGLWLLFFYVVPGVLITLAILLGIFGIAGESSANLAVAALLGLAAFAIAVWMFVELGCLRGTVGPNRYGPDPLDPAAPAPAPAH